MPRFLLAALLALSFSASASNGAIQWDEQVRILNRSAVPVAPSPVGQWYPVALVEAGATYSIEILNPLDERVQAVISIDGINPFTGRKSTRSGGVVMDPGQKTIIDVWVPRKNTGPQPLVSPRQGRINKINVAFFREVDDRPMSPPNMAPPPPSTNPAKWVPPAGTVFYPRSNDPEQIVHRRVGPAAPTNPL